MKCPDCRRQVLQWQALAGRNGPAATKRHRAAIAAAGQLGGAGHRLRRLRAPAVRPAPRPSPGRRTLALQELGEEEGELQRLVGIEPRVAMGVVAVRKIRLRDRPRAAGAFGDVLAGHLDMDAAGIGALRPVDGEEVLAPR